MSLKISLLVMVVGIIGLWYVGEAVLTLSESETSEGEQAFWNLIILTGVFMVVETAGIIMCAYYGWKRITVQKKQSKTPIQ